MFPMKSDAVEPGWAQTAGFDELFPMLTEGNWAYSCDRLPLCPKFN